MEESGPKVDLKVRVRNFVEHSTFWFCIKIPEVNAYYEKGTSWFWLPVSVPRLLVLALGAVVTGSCSDEG